jgi:hypothetical protein
MKFAEPKNDGKVYRKFDIERWLVKERLSDIVDPKSGEVLFKQVVVLLVRR